MRQSRERSRLAGLQSDLLDGNDQTLSTRLPEHNTHYLPQGNAPFSHPYAGVDPLDTLASQNLSVNGDLVVEGELGQSLAGLELNDNDSFSNSEPPDSTIGRTNNISANADWPQHVPEAVNSWLLFESANNRTSEAYVIPTSSQPSYGADSSSAGPLLSHRFGESFANLRPPTYTPQKSSPATQSQCSDSAWETLPPSPFADDNDSWLVPDENSASMQSYNDPRTGIWAPEDAYGPGTAYSSMRDMGHDNSANDNGGNFTMTQLLQPHLQQVIANADAATPFRAQPDSNGGGFLVNAGLGANESPQIAAPLFSPRSTSGGLLSQSFQSSINGHSGISIVIDSTMNLGASSARQSQAVERFFYPLGSDQSSFSNIAPGITLDNPPLDLPYTMLTGTLAPAPSPSPSADTSTAEFVRCSHGGCQAKFRGEFWKDSLRRHNTRIHGDKTNPTCPVCGLVFKSRRPDNVIRHIMTQHPGSPLPASRNARPRKLARRRRRS